MAMSHSQELERAAQAMAKLLQEDYSGTRMVEHYLGTISPADPRIVEIVTQAGEVVQPLLDLLSDAEIEQSLLNHKLRSCRAEHRNLAEYLSTMPERVPAVGGAFQRDDVIAWLRSEIAKAPIQSTGRATP